LQDARDDVSEHAGYRSGAVIGHERLVISGSHHAEASTRGPSAMSSKRVCHGRPRTSPSSPHVTVIPRKPGPRVAADCRTPAAAMPAGGLSLLTAASTAAVAYLPPGSVVRAAARSRRLGQVANFSFGHRTSSQSKHASMSSGISCAMNRRRSFLQVSSSILHPPQIVTVTIWIDSLFEKLRH
jgi:hypothetical protein